MKKIILLFLTLIIYSQFYAQKLDIKEGIINVKNKKVGNGSTFIGKIGLNYLLCSANPKGIGGMNYFTFNPPKLFLVNEKFAILSEADLNEQFKKTDYIYEDIIVFSKKILIIFSEYNKKERQKTFYLSELNTNNFAINFTAKKLLLTETEYKRVGNTNLLSYHPIFSMSEDKSKLLITFISSLMPSGVFNIVDIIKKEVNISKITLAHLFAYDADLNIIYKTDIPYNESKIDLCVFAAVINNNGISAIGSTYNALRPNGKKSIYEEKLYNITAYKIDAKGVFSEEILKIEKNMYVPDYVLKIDNNNIFISGLVSTYIKSDNIVFGYINYTINNKENLVTSKISKFSDFFSKEFDGNNNILKYKGIITMAGIHLTNDGYCYNLSELRGNDIIISKTDKEGKTIWAKNIDRKFYMGFNLILGTNIGTFYNETTKDFYVIYRISSNFYYVKFSENGEMSESQEFGLPNKDYIGNQISKNEFIYMSTNGNINFGIIKF